MSTSNRIVENEKIDNNQVIPENKIEEKQLKNNEQIENSKNISISAAKKLIERLLKNNLNESLLKLETKNKNQINSLKLTKNSSNDILNLIQNIFKNMEETEKKKNKDKKSKFLNINKRNTEHRSMTRSKSMKSIQSSLFKFKSKAALDKIENNKNNNSKGYKKINPKMNQLANRTMTNFRIERKENRTIEEYKHSNMNKSQSNLFRTSQNFRKTNNKYGWATPSSKIREKNLEKTFNDKNVNVTQTNIKKSYYSRRTENILNKKAPIKISMLNNLSDIDENLDDYKMNHTKRFNRNKDIKGLLNKNDKSNTISGLTCQLDTIVEKKNKQNNNKPQVKEKEVTQKQVENMIKMVDDAYKNVNNNLDKINENEKKVKPNIKEGNINNKKKENKHKNNNSINNAINETKIKGEKDIHYKKIQIPNLNNNEKNACKVNKLNSDIDKLKEEKNKNTKEESLTLNNNSKECVLVPKTNNQKSKLINKSIDNKSNHYGKNFEKIQIMELKKHKSIPNIKTIYNSFINSLNNSKDLDLKDEDKENKNNKEIINEKENLIKEEVDKEKKDINGK